MTFDSIALTPKLDKEISGILETREEYIKIADNTPSILVKAGLMDKPLYLPCKKIVKGLTSGDMWNHGHRNEIGKKTIKKALPHLSDPLAISFTEDNAFGVYLETKASTGRPVYVYIRYDKDKDINIILSIYGRIATVAEKFVYIDDTKLRNRWDTNSYLIKKFKGRLEDEVYKETCLTKTMLLRNKKKGEI